MRGFLWLTGVVMFTCPLLAWGEEGIKVMRWNVMDTGAMADAETDNTDAFQQTLDTAGKAGGGVVEVPAGRYRFEGTLSVPRGVTLQGTYRVPPTVARKDDQPDGSILLAYAGRGSEEGPPFIRLAGSNSAIAGLVVVYPQWQQSDVPPVPYPPCARVAEHRKCRHPGLLLSESVRSNQTGSIASAFGAQRDRLSQPARPVC